MVDMYPPFLDSRLFANKKRTESIRSFCHSDYLTI